MKRLITLGDFIETYTKLNQRGFGFISSKLKFNEIERAKTAFNHLNPKSSNWWDIPMVQERWNMLISGDKHIGTEQFTTENFLKGSNNLKMLSLGSGGCYSEFKFSQYSNFEEIVCTDIADKLLNEAQKIAKKNGLKNIKFKVKDVNNLTLPKNHYDIVYFRASLHHFKDVESLIKKQVIKTLKEDGLLIIDEYVGPNRMQFPKSQLKCINESIKLIPKKFRKRFNINLYKNKVYGAGLIRMILADPSECIDSASIKPVIYKHFDTISESGYGGNILTLALKDIAHHFLELDKEKENILKSLFKFEDEYLKNHTSDFVFGIYKLKKTKTTLNSTN